MQGQLTSETGSKDGCRMQLGFGLGSRGESSHIRISFCEVKGIGGRGRESMSLRKSMRRGRGNWPGIYEVMLSGFV